MADSKLIVIEGLDGSGKATQTEILAQRLRQNGYKVTKLSFPNYQSPSSSLVKMYLGGEFGDKPESVNPYTASAFYAVDRAASFLQMQDTGGLLLADRYTTSNAIYQLSKIAESERGEFLNWLADFEYNKLAIPAPDLVIYLDMEPAASQKLMSMRYGGDETRKDIHESNLKFLLECRRSALFAAEKLGWKVITCSRSEQVRSPEDIAEEIYSTIEGQFNL